MFGAVLLMLLPNVSVIILTIVTLVILSKARRIARKIKRSVRWQGDLTVLVTGIVFCGSTLPITLYLLISPFVKDTPVTQRWVSSFY